MFIQHLRGYVQKRDSKKYYLLILNTFFYNNNKKGVKLHYTNHF